MKRAKSAKQLRRGRKFNKNFERYYKKTEIKE